LLSRKGVDADGNTEDPEFSLALLRAYNDCHVEEWCGAYPARFIPMCLPAIWDPEACAAEVRRFVAKASASTWPRAVAQYDGSHLASDAPRGTTVG
jgi:predicted TIM-barrel fold metal-dependent hydrolase